MLVQKHFRLPRETVEQLEKRDMVRYPSEASYVNAAVLYFERKEGIEEKLEEIQQELKEIHALCRQEVADSDIYGKNFSY